MHIGCLNSEGKNSTRSNDQKYSQAKPSQILLAIKYQDQAKVIKIKFIYNA